MKSAVQHLSSPAKLTLTLRMTGLRDDGFHLLDAEMVSLDFGDDIAIESVDGPGQLRVIDEHGASIPGIPLDESNLVNRALTLAGQAANVTLTKRIPPGAGLGGGSANAATVLRWAGFTDLAAASGIGADISFCMIGGRARVTGVGEIVEPLPFVPQTLTLLTPPFGCSTSAVYRVWDDLGGPSGENGNDLEAAALVVEPRLAQWRDQLGELSGHAPRLAGSGSTWFVTGAFEGPGTRVVNTIPAEPLPVTSRTMPT